MITNTAREIQYGKQEANVFEQMWIRCCELCLWINPLFHFNTLVWLRPDKVFVLLALEYLFGKIYMGREAVNLFPRGGICPSPRATDSATWSFVYEKEQEYNYPIMELVLK